MPIKLDQLLNVNLFLDTQKESVISLHSPEIFLETYLSIGTLQGEFKHLNSIRIHQRNIVFEVATHYRPSDITGCELSAFSAQKSRRRR